jgi:putative ABC transport system ATP-binding protein
MVIPLIEARNVSKVLGAGAGQVRALKNIDLSITGGKLTVLMGPSGSGKTTPLSILGCMLAPTEGSVFTCGHATQGARPE